MKKKFIKYISLSLIILSLSSCNFLDITPHLFKNIFRINEKKVFRSYSEFIHTLNLPGSTVSLIHLEEELQNNSLFKETIHTNSNIQYFPATLWQVYALKNKPEWKEQAEKYSSLILDQQGSQPNNEAQLYSVCMNSYRISGIQQLKESALESLSKSMIGNRSDADSFNQDHSFRILLENEHLLYATKETGDPIYKRLAITNADKIYHQYFKQNTSNEVLYGMLNWNEPPGKKELEELTTSDFYNLAVSFYGFTILDNEIGIKQYNELTRRLDIVFRGIFKTVPGDRKLAPERSSVKEKIDLTSRALICLGLQNFNNFGNKYDCTAESVFESILKDLELSDKANGSLDTLRLYYYLFEYVAG